MQQYWAWKERKDNSWKQTEAGKGAEENLEERGGGREKKKGEEGKIKEKARKDFKIQTRGLFFKDDSYLENQWVESSFGILAKSPGGS